jgi:hypothetical protein
MKSTTAWAVMWIATSIAIIAGIYITKNANCLWAFLLPAFNGISVKAGSEKEQI